MPNDENLQGISDLIRKLDELGSLDNGKALRAAARAGMVPVLNAAKRKIPVGTRQHRAYHKKGQAQSAEMLQPGYAKEHLRLATSLSTDKKTANAVVTTNKKAYYAVMFVERGTKKQPAQPWLRPAFYENQSAIKQAMYDKLNAYIVKLTKDQANSFSTADSDLARGGVGISVGSGGT